MRSVTLGALLALMMGQPSSPAGQSSEAPRNWTAADDHRNMMDQLGIRALRPGPSGNEKAPNAANYDEARANPFPDYPDPLTLKDGRRVTTAELWTTERRAEIVEDFEREIVGRVPQRVPKITWTVTETVQTAVGGRPVIGKRLVGRADNSAHPEISVEIQMVLVTPADVERPAPVMIMFRGGGLPGDPVPEFMKKFAPPPGSDPPAHEQLIADGWGYAFLNPSSVQADNGANLTKGVVGLANRGQPRKPDDWGALRAWAWGASRALDYLETDRTIDAARVGIEGVSRFGKAALVTMAFDGRFAVALIGSAGEGGVSPYRRNFGEMVENLTGSGQYHWMAGNFLKYGAADATFGSRNARDLPVDAHELIALCAPRPVFVSYGVPERGDALWLDQQGSYMATVAAGAVYRLLGTKDLGTREDYRTARMPPVNVGLLDGHLAWRQHDGGHTDGPNWKYFIPWANRALKRSSEPAKKSTVGPADRPAPRLDPNSLQAHAELVAKAKQGRIDVYFVGDSITRRWGAVDYPELLGHWKANFFGWNAANFGWGADRIEHMLWRLEYGELEGVQPKIIVVLAGTNNVGAQPGGDEKIADIARGLQALVDLCRRKAPDATIILTAIFPRNDHMAVIPEIWRLNTYLASLADGRTIRYVDVNSRLADRQGRFHEGMTTDTLHPTVKAYQIWADALKPILSEILGPPAATDLAPPPTGDPGARGRAAR